MVELVNKREAWVLFIGDVVVFYASLWIALFVRYFRVPSINTLQEHLVPFSILFAVWVIIFFISGLYDKHRTLLKNNIPNIIFNTQMVNSGIAVLFFYLIPYFGITPKTTLFIYLVVSFGLVLWWRKQIALKFTEKEQENAIIVGSGKEMRELIEEINKNPRYGIKFVSSVDLLETEHNEFEKGIINHINEKNISVAVVDTNDPKIVPVLPKFYELIFSKTTFVDMNRMYEDIFDRVPLSLVRYDWFLENIRTTNKFTYEFMKRFMDVVITLPIFIVSLVFYPFIILFQQIENKGPVFYVANRVGENNSLIPVVKFRTMTGVDFDKPNLKTKHDVTKVGKILRKTRLDELPQLWNVLKGDLSLIGPRPEFPALVEHYVSEVPFYNIRHIVKPGLSGWGQINDTDVPRKDADVGKTRRKLSYDLYYIKNRSLILDLKIALKTVKTILSRTGS